MNNSSFFPLMVPDLTWLTPTRMPPTLMLGSALLSWMTLDALVLPLCSGLCNNVRWTLERYGFEWHGSTERPLVESADAKRGLRGTRGDGELTLSYRRIFCLLRGWASQTSVLFEGQLCLSRVSFLTLG